MLPPHSLSSKSKTRSSRVIFHTSLSRCFHTPVPRRGVFAASRFFPAASAFSRPACGSPAACALFSRSPADPRRCERSQQSQNTIAKSMPNPYQRRAKQKEPTVSNGFPFSSFQKFSKVTDIESSAGPKSNRFMFACFYSEPFYVRVSDSCAQPPQDSPTPVFGLSLNSSLSLRTQLLPRAAASTARTSFSF